ncbi:MAG: sterol desaturase family protein [Pirellulales bacterium]
MVFQIEPKTIVAACALCVLWLAERQFPFFLDFWRGAGGGRDRVRHDAKNVALGVANALIATAVAGGLLVAVEVASGEVGLLRWLSLGAVATVVLALLLLDFWTYVWHRLNHVVPFLWRFHRMHHSDPNVDASTGVRFHTGEIVMSGLARAALLPILGLSLAQLALYDAILLPLVLFHHSNVGLPRWLDYGLTWCVVTPAMHRVHHSCWRPETDSNFASILPLWDRLFRTFGLRDDAHTIHLGLVEFEDRKWQTLWGMARTPAASLERDAASSGQFSP